MSTFTFSTTEKNKPLLNCKGFAYTIDKATDDKTYWKCGHVRKFKCKGRIHTNCAHTTLLHENDSHNHPALNSNEATQNVIDYCLTNLSDHAVARVPDFKHVKRNIRNHRVKKDLPEIPHDKTFNVIPDKLTTTKRNSLFLQFDSDPGNDRIIIFALAEQLQLLESGEQLLVDGTFKVCNTIDFLSIIRYARGLSKCCFTCRIRIITKQTQQTYRRLIDELSGICSLWSPKFIMVDFELASINTFGDKCSYIKD
ncbi:unnamed protein product [Rotaria socialis]|uniref:FLYWCH-type domain-containing protein n=1 Tax=Rotaria socialis TaxID=392032 RepID=A0A820WEE0_9BILA|nr:unnamed protein product [Rotaria socialis]CAF3504608.1 unnamed protein product [Rotaria socialis]CAF4466528.1 unnamed protein product [Rotaria socialis]CAF4514510.1 unnamed protein product [Rotaria socialis]CAF4613945.1 unnamed protein product [Rotaria socialis]